MCHTHMPDTMMSSTSQTNVNTTAERYNFTQEREVLVWTSIALSVPATVVCVISIVILLILKAYKKYLYRLVIYLIIAILAEALLDIGGSTLDIVNAYSECENRTGILCNVIAYFYAYTRWFKSLVTLWISGYIFVLIIFRKRLMKRWMEVTTLFLFITVPPVILGLRFFQTDYEQEYQFECINTFTILLSCTLIPMTLSVLMMSILACMVCRALNDKFFQYELKKKYRQVLKDSLPFIVFPAISSLAIGFDSFVHLYSLLIRKESFPLLVSHNVAESLEQLLIPTVLIFNPGTLSMIRRRMKKSTRTESECNESTPITPLTRQPSPTSHLP